jgi:hypothetical protein
MALMHNRLSPSPSPFFSVTFHAVTVGVDAWG